MEEVFEKIKNGIQVKKDYFQRFYECEGKTKHDADLNKATQLAFDDAIKVVDRVAAECLVCQNAWKSIYDKVVSLEYEYAENGEEDAVNDCIRLENLLQYFKEELQSAEEYKDGWIPCSERLPEENQMVITCDKDGWVSVHVNILYKGKKNDLECGYYVAWMPLPEPYKGE